MQKNQPPEQGKLLRKAEVLARIPIGSTNWDAGVKSGKYPAAIYLSPRIKVWRQSDITALIAALAA